jgi:hypothetical protein
MDARALRLRRIATMGLPWVLCALVVVGTPWPARAATGDWGGTATLTLTRTEVRESFQGHGPDLMFTVVDDTLTSVTFSEGYHSEFGFENACVEDSDTVLTSHEGGSIIVGSSGTSLLVQAVIDGYETLTTEVFTGPTQDPYTCFNGTVQTPNTFQATARGTFVTLLSPDQEAASGSVVLVDTSNDGQTRFERLDYAVHRDCAGFDADGDGVADCQELENGTDPSDPGSTAPQSQISPTGTTCSQFASGTGTNLQALRYSLKNNRIQQVNPGVFFYWVRVPGSGTYTITQTVLANTVTKPFAIANGSFAYGSDCAKQSAKPAQDDIGTVTLSVTGSGTSYIGIKYNAQSLVGQPTPDPVTMHYEFATAGIAGSIETLDVQRKSQ